MFILYKQLDTQTYKLSGSIITKRDRYKNKKYSVSFCKHVLLRQVALPCILASVTGGNTQAIL